MTRGSEDLLPSSDDVNRAQRDYWDSEGRRQYQDYEETNEALFAPFGEAMLDTARLQPGDRVLDVGCGHGTSTMEAAERVAPTGQVVGVDISAVMLEPAQRRVDAAVLGNVELLQTDAQVHRFEPSSFDAVISRFGMMFFADPQVAFANLAQALRPERRLTFVCWQDPRKSEWVAVALGALVSLLGRVPDVGSPGAPGPFAFADGDRLTGLLTRGGFRQVTLETLTRPVRIGRDLDDAVGFVMSLPQGQQVLAGADEATVATAMSALRAAYTPYAGPHGVVMDAAAWLVSANR